MFIKRLCVEGCNEAVLLRPSSQPILGGDYVFIGKEESHRAQLPLLEVGGVKEDWGGGVVVISQPRTPKDSLLLCWCFPLRLQLT